MKKTATESVNRILSIKSCLSYDYSIKLKSIKEENIYHSDEALNNGIEHIIRQRRLIATHINERDNTHDQLQELYDVFDRYTNELKQLLVI